MFERLILLCSGSQLVCSHCCEDTVLHSCVFLHPEDGHSGCIHSGAIVNIVAITHLVHAFGGTREHISVGLPFQASFSLELGNEISDISLTGLW